MHVVSSRGYAGRDVPHMDEAEFLDRTRRVAEAFRPAAPIDRREPSPYERAVREALARERAGGRTTS